MAVMVGCSAASRFCVQQPTPILAGLVEMMNNKVMFDSCLTIFCWKDSFIIKSGAGFRFKPELFEHFLGGLRFAEILQAQQKIRSSTVELGSHHRSISKKTVMFCCKR